jgi:hypothetical protein
LNTSNTQAEALSLCFFINSFISFLKIMLNTSIDIPCRVINRTIHVNEIGHLKIVIKHIT